MSWFRCTGGSGGSLKLRTASGRIATFETNLADELQSLKCEIVATGGNGTPENPIPLVGHSELNLTRCGKNLFDNSNFPSGYGSIVATYNADGTVILNGTASGNEYFSIPINLPNTNYVMLVGNTSANANVHVSFVNHNSEFYGDNDLSTTNKVVNISGDISAIVFYVLSGTTLTDFTIKPMLELGSTPSAYEPYNGTPFTVAFGQTVYGCVYDKSGRLTITHGYKTYDGSNDEDWGFVDAVNRAYISVSDIDISTPDSDIADVKANIYVSGAYSGNGNRITGRYNIAQINVFDSSVNNISEWRALLSNTPLTVAYELATPIVIDVPSISVSAEKGTNNVFSDCGDTEVKYLYKA